MSAPSHTERRSTDALALEIARCPIIQAVRIGDPTGDACREVVSYQKRPPLIRWVPEPWSGHLSSAPILFLSSNPSSGKPDGKPTPTETIASSLDEQVLHNFEDAFDEGPWPGVLDGEYVRLPDGLRADYVPYWHWCKVVAEELLGRAVRPGHDYALTEVVHCGSRSETGVKKAARECVPRYLKRVLGASSAPVIVVVGAVARDMVKAFFPSVRGGKRRVASVEISDHERHLVFLPHPSAYGPKTIRDNFKPDGDIVLAELRQALNIVRR